MAGAGVTTVGVELDAGGVERVNFGGNAFTVGALKLLGLETCPFPTELLAARFKVFFGVLVSSGGTSTYSMGIA